MSEKPVKHISKRVGRNVFEKPPRISVVIPAYNSAEYICEAIESVLSQKYREQEIIVVNDGSPDTVQFERNIRIYLEDITYIRQRNAGAGAARNTGIEHARGELIAFLDADDVWLPEFLASQYIFLERNGYDMVYCDATLFGTRSAYRTTLMESAPSTGVCDFDSILRLQCNVITSGTLVRKSAVIKAGMFEDERVLAEDFHLWLRIAATGARIGYQTKPLLKYRMHADGLSGGSVSRVKRSIGAFRRVRNTIELTEAQRQYVDGQLAGFEADLAVERGKSHLLKGEYREAAGEFKTANSHRRSIKLAVISFLASIAPSLLLKIYRSNRSSEIPLVQKT